MRQRKVTALLVALVTVLAAVGLLSGAAHVASASTTAGITVAGGNGQGSAANQLDLPNDVFVDGAGNIYVADSGNNRVQKWAPGATAGVTVAGGNGAGSAANQLDIPYGVFVDSAGNVYVSDELNNRVQKWAPGATAGVTVAGGNGAGSAANQLDNPNGLFVDSSGDIYVADELNNRVQEWTPGASAGVTVAGGNGEGSAANQLQFPTDVFVHGAGDVYVADDTGRIQEWAPEATAGVTVAGGNGAGTGANQLYDGVGVFVDSAGDVYVTDDARTFSSRVQEWAPGATSGITVAGGPAGSAANQLDGASGLFVDGAGDVYVADWENNRVQEWEPGPKGAPLDTLDPQSQTVLEGANATFSAGALASPYPAVQWQQSTDGGTTWSDVSGATSPAYTIPAPPYSDTGDEFRAVFTNGAGSVTTASATLTVDPVPTTTMLVPLGGGCCPNGPPLSGTTYFDASASSGPVSVTKVQFEVTGADLDDAVVSTATPTVYGWIGSWNTTTVPNSEYAVQSVATNSVGVSALSADSALFEVDNPPPKTKVLIPSAGAVESGGAVLDAAAPSANVTSVVFKLTGGPDDHTEIAAGHLTLYGWLAQWNTTSVPNGTYNLTSVASYAGGVKGTSAPVTITVSN